MEGLDEKDRYSDGKLKLVGAWLPVPSPLTGGTDAELAIHDADRIRLDGEFVDWTEFVGRVTTPEHRGGKATVYVEGEGGRGPDGEELEDPFIQHEVDLQLVGSMRFAFKRIPEGAE